jgi:hypothetical protein
MCIYCGTNKYRKIYEEHYGSIPKEENGRSYEIHHIDNDHNNNDPLNLKCVTLQEHYDIHHNQGDYDACRLMKLQRMNYTVEEIKELNSKAKKGKISVKDPITGKSMGMISIHDERYLNRELVPVSTGLKIKYAEKNCKYCNKLFTVNIINRHEKTCNLNVDKISLTHKKGTTSCQFCAKTVGNSNIRKHELSCTENPNKIKGVNYGKKYNITKKICSFCNSAISAIVHNRHENKCKLNLTKPLK